jgi:hypothetical protein
MQLAEFYKAAGIEPKAKEEWRRVLSSERAKLLLQADTSLKAGN